MYFGEVRLVIEKQLPIFSSGHFYCFFDETKSRSRKIKIVWDFPGEDFTAPLPKILSTQNVQLSNPLLI